MGIRFACPNGHPLHVKADLAGKRGICPECEARFKIPAPRQAATAHSTTASQSGTENVATPTPSGESILAAKPQAEAARPASNTSGTPPAPEPETAGESGAAEAPLWYVRPAAGGQFGPADDTLIRQWAAEGRVAADAYVWRSGWPDWRRASEVPEYFPELAGGEAPTVPLGVPSGYNRPDSGPSKESAAPADVSLATARYQRRKKRAARGQQLAAVVLVLLVIVLAVVLVLVVRASTPSEAPPDALPAATDANPPNTDVAEPPEADADNNPAMQPTGDEG